MSTNVALGKPVLEANVENPRAATDGVTNNYDRPGYSAFIWPGHLTVDLERPCHLRLIRVLLWNRDQRAYKYRLDLSLDDAVYVEVHDNSNYGARGWQVIVLDPPVKARFIRIDGLHNTNNNKIHILEVEAYEELPVPLKPAAEATVVQPIVEEFAASEEPTPRIESVAQYAEYIGRGRWDEDALFRGQRQDLPLLPRIARPLDFRPKKRLGIAQTEQSMLADFKSRSVPFLSTEVQGELEWLALAQHHGMATRLLDWTANAMAALWFAVERPPAEEKDGTRLDAVVWTVRRRDSDRIRDEERSSPFVLNRTVLFQPRHITPRIVAQSGWFSLHAGGGGGSESSFVALEEDPRYALRVRKLHIVSTSFAVIRRQLDVNGTNGAALYADLPSLCRHIDWQHSFLEDEP
jgi:hypothetical protein